MFGQLFTGLSNLFDKLIQIVIKLKCRVVCCSKNFDHVGSPTEKEEVLHADTFTSLD